MPISNWEKIVPMRYDDAHEVPGPIEIHVVKNHQIEKIYTVKEYILSIALDEEENYMYGMCGDSAIYRETSVIYRSIEKVLPTRKKMCQNS